MNLRDMITLVESQIKPIVTSTEYYEAISAIELSEAVQIDWERRYQGWVKVVKRALFQIYINRLKEGNKDALECSWLEWSRLQFFIVNYNAQLNTKLNNEINDLIKLAETGD